MKLYALILALMLAGCACGRGYSEGDRTGVINKLSYKGLIFKSWEGEMLLGGMRGGRDSDGNATMSANIWAFSIHDQSAVKAAQLAMTSGMPVTAHYIQWFSAGPGYNSDYELISVNAGKQ